MAAKRSEAAPRWATKRNNNRKTLGLRAAKVAKRLGTPLMPHQRLIADVGLELLPDGRPAFDQVVVTIPRQNGKTVLARAVLVERAERVDEQFMVYTAQDRIAARKRVLELGRSLQRLQYPIERVREAIGSELVEWENATRLEVVSPTASGGHGDTIDLAVLDEMWKLQQHVLDGIEPARIARPLSQMWGISTMGTDESEVLNHFVEVGREAVENPDSRLAYFEWSMDPEIHDIYNPDDWWDFMPALGWTVTPETILAKIETQPKAVALRAYGNVRTKVEAAAIPEEWWLETEEVNLAPMQGLALAVDQNVGPAGVSIAAAWEEHDVRVVALVDYQAGPETAWVEDRLGVLVSRFRPCVVAVDGAGPAASLAADIRDLCEREFVPFREFKSRDVTAAAGHLFSQLKLRSVRHNSAEPLDEAVAGATQKKVGDLWRFDRYASPVDVSPLVAASVALFAFHQSQLSDVAPSIF